MDVIFAQHAVLDHVDFQRFLGFVVLHRFGHEFGYLFFQRFQIDEPVDGTQQVDVQKSGAFVARLGHGLQLLPDAADDVSLLRSLQFAPHGVVLDGDALVELAEEVLPQVHHVEVPHGKLRRK